MREYKSSKTIKALIEASTHITNLCVMNPDYAHELTHFSKVLEEALQEIEHNTRHYVGRMKK